MAHSKLVTSVELSLKIITNNWIINIENVFRNTRVRNPPPPPPPLIYQLSVSAHSRPKNMYVYYSFGLKRDGLGLNHKPLVFSLVILDSTVDRIPLQSSLFPSNTCRISSIFSQWEQRFFTVSISEKIYFLNRNGQETIWWAKACCVKLNFQFQLFWLLHPIRVDGRRSQAVIGCMPTQSEHAHSREMFRFRLSQMASALSDHV